MPEVLEPKQTITPEQRTWANAILRLAGSSPSPEKPEPEEEEEEEEEELNFYGKGLKSNPIAIDNRTVPVPITEALQPGAAPLSLLQWQQVMEGRKPSATTLKKLSEKSEEIGNSILSLEARMEERRQALLIAHTCTTGLTRKTPSCDLSGFGENVLTTEIQIKERREQAWEDARRLMTEMEEDRKHAALVLEVLDSPGNNPEHLQVGAGLEALEKLEKKYGKSRDEKQEKAYIKEKSVLLFRLQDVVFAWNNRRVSENLPPAGDAVAMAEMVQRLHNEMMATVIDKKLPLPLSEENEKNLSKEEKEKLQKTWTALLESDKNGSKENARLVVGTPSLDQPLTKDSLLRTEDQAKQFRVEILSNLSRLLQSGAGRELVGQLNDGKYEVKFAPGTSAGQAPNNWTEARGGKGCGSTINMVPGAKDSDVALSTGAGNQLFAARFIAMGHEMVHALHSAQGCDRGALPMGGVDTGWNNLEEYQTIFKGKLSENTLRQQYGMSAERFGHGSVAKGEPVFKALAEGVKVGAKLHDPESAKWNDTLEERGFKPPGSFPDKLKIAICESQLRGPLPGGWEPGQLTFAQLTEIIGPPTIAGDLRKYGWTPYGLDGKRIQEIYDHKEHHPRSPKGLRMRTLGGVDAVDGFAELEKNTGIKLAAPKGKTWEDKLEALEAAHEKLTEISAKHTNSLVKDAARGSGKLPKRFQALTKVFLSTKKSYETEGGETALAEITRFNTVFQTSLAKEGADYFSKLEALQKAGEKAEELREDWPSSARGKVKSAKGIGAKLRVMADLQEEAVKDFTEMGGAPAVKLIDDYQKLLNRNYYLTRGDNVVSHAGNLRKTREDLKELKQESVSTRFQSAIAGSNVLATMQAAMQIWRQLETEYEAYGARPAHRIIPDLAQLTARNLGAKGSDMPEHVDDLLAASDALTEYAQTQPQEIQTIARAKKSLVVKYHAIIAAQKRLQVSGQAVQEVTKRKEAMNSSGQKIADQVSEDKTNEFLTKGKAKKSQLKDVVEAMRAIGTNIKKGPTEDLDALLLDFEDKARTYVQDHGAPRTPNGKKRKQAASDMLQVAEQMRVDYTEAQEQGKEAKETAILLQLTPEEVDDSAVQALREVAAHPYLSQALRESLEMEIKGLALEVEKAKNLRASELEEKKK